MEIGEKILNLLTSKNMSQKQLASELNIALSTLNGYIRNYREPDYNMIIAIARLLDTTVDYLVGFTNLPNYKIYNDIYNDYNLLPREGREQLHEYISFLKFKYNIKD